MLVDTCIVASNNNDFYLDFFPAVNRCWKDICGIRCLLVLVSHEIPEKLQPFKDDIILFKPIPGVSDILVSQIIRLLYPCLLSDKTSNGVIISDIDLIPMNKSFYIDNATNIPNDKFLVYRDVCLNYGQIAMCFNAATPSVWKEVWKNSGVTVHSEQNIIEFLQMISQGVLFDGRPGESGWFTDQLVLYRIVMLFKQAPNNRVVVLKDTENGFKRLDRADTQYIEQHKTIIREEVKRGDYSDYHMPRPWKDYKSFLMYFLQDVLSNESQDMINRCVPGTH